MKKLLYIVTITSTILLFSGCSKTLLINQGTQGYAGELDDKYITVQLKEVSSTSSTFFGLGGGDMLKNGIITNYEDVSLHQNNPLLRFLSLLACSAILPIITPASLGSLLGGAAIGGALNNMAWSSTNGNMALRQANLKLIEENRDIDLFIYPKYEINLRKGLFNTKANVTIISKGAKLKLDK